MYEEDSVLRVFFPGLDDVQYASMIMEFSTWYAAQKRKWIAVGVREERALSVGIHDSKPPQDIPAHRTYC